MEDLSISPTLYCKRSSQWVIGRNVTRKANIEHIGKNALTFEAHGEQDYISLTNSGFLSYVLLDRFVKSTSVGSTLTGLSGGTLDQATLDQKPWAWAKSIIDKVHKHVCGHANFTDFQLLLKRNDLWNEAVASYVQKLVEGCTACPFTAPPQPSRKVSISSMSTQFNQVVCVDHFYLDEIRLMHCMDLVSRFSAIQVVDSETLADAVAAFEACWMSHFWYPESIHGDKAFAVGDFKTYMDEVSISFRPMPPGRHSKNAIESKHKVIRSIYLRLKDAAGDRHNARYASYKAVSISNDLYGNNTLGAFEMARGYTKPVMCKTALSAVPDDVIDAHEKLRARRKLAFILNLKVVKEIPIQVGDLVEVYQKKQHEKRGKWSVPKPVISVDHAARSVTVPGKAERDVYVRPLRESPAKTTYLWLLLTASYGLVNANAKWQNQSDERLLEYGLYQSRQVTQLFFKREAGKLVLVLAKIVDDLKVAGTRDRAKAFLDVFDSRFKLGTINSGTGKLRFFGINTVQHEDFTVATDANDKLESVSEHPITRQRRTDSDDDINSIEKSAFASVNSSLG